MTPQKPVDRLKASCGNLSRMLSTLPTYRHVRFIEEACRRPADSATSWAVAAGYPEKSAAEAARRLLEREDVWKALQAHRQLVAKAAGIDAATVLQEIVAIACGDTTEISHTRRVCCRYCWGEGHKYQWRAREFADAWARADQLTKKAQDEGKSGDDIQYPGLGGGLDFNATREPHEGCPECDGEGHEQDWIADMRKLTPAQRRLIAGVERTKDGVKVKYRDQDGMLKLAAQFVGVANTQKTDKPGAASGEPPPASSIPDELPLDAHALGQLYAKAMG